MDSNHSSETQGAEQERKEELNFGNLAEIMKKMGSLVGTVATDFNSTMTNVSDVFEKIGVSLTEEDRNEVDELFDNLSDEDRTDLMEMVKEKADGETVGKWWSKRCDNEHLVDVFVSCSDAFNELFNTTSDIETLLSETLGQLSKGGNQFENIFGGITGELSNLFSKSTTETKTNETESNKTESNKTESNEPNVDYDETDSKTNEPRNPEPTCEGGVCYPSSETNVDSGDEDNYAKVFSNLGNCVSEMMQTFNETGDDVPTIRGKVIHAFSDTGVDKNYMGKCFDIGFEMGEKLNAEVADPNISDGNDNNGDGNDEENNNNDGNDDGNDDENKENAIDDIFKGLEEVFGDLGGTFKDIKEVFNEYTHKLEDVQEGGEFEVLKEGVKMFGTKFGISQGEQDKLTDAISQSIGFGQKLENEIKDNVRHGLIDEAAKMVGRSNQLTEECSTLIGLLNPIELRILQLHIGRLPISARINRLETTLSVIEQKLDQVINKLDVSDIPNSSSEQGSSDRFDSLEEKLDDIALDLELIRNKSIKRTVIKY